MSYSAALDYYDAFGGSRAVSENARRVERAVASYRVQTPASESQRSDALVAFQNAIEYAATAHSQDRNEPRVEVSAAVGGWKFLEMLLELLAPFAILPEIDVDYDGHISFEWLSADGQVLSIRISPEGRLYYAGILGQGTFHGAEMLGNRIPPKVERAIREIEPIVSR